MKKIVLGSGPIGLICAYFEKANLVIGNRIGVSKLNYFAPYYIWHTTNVERFFKELGLSTETKEIKVGCIDKNFNLIDHTLNENRVRYYIQTRNNDNFSKFSMSNGKKIIKVMKVSVDELCKRILELKEFDIINEKFNKESLDFDDHIINTLPANIYDNKYYNKYYDYFYKYFSVKKIDKRLISIKKQGYDYIYSLDNKFNRIKFLDDKYCIYEYSRSNLLILKFDKDVIDNYIILQVCGKVKNGLDKNGYDKDGVKHVGRMSRWDYSIRIHNVIDDYYKGVK